ncbi:hypothetical protein JYU23_01335 [bacterium AH-315-C07]|nr:hypothetical protein [bacterium AH-315-C07]
MNSEVAEKSDQQETAEEAIIIGLKQQANQISEIPTGILKVMRNRDKLLNTYSARIADTVIGISKFVRTEIWDVGTNFRSYLFKTDTLLMFGFNKVDRIGIMYYRTKYYMHLRSKYYHLYPTGKLEELTLCMDTLLIKRAIFSLQDDSPFL